MACADFDYLYPKNLQNFGLHFYTFIPIITRHISPQRRKQSFSGLIVQRHGGELALGVSFRSLNLFYHASLVALIWTFSRILIMKEPLILFYLLRCAFLNAYSGGRLEIGKKELFKNKHQSALSQFTGAYKKAIYGKLASIDAEGAPNRLLVHPIF